MSYQGGCLCGNVRYAMKTKPMIVHACHCTQCQHVTGSAFVMNAINSKDDVQLLSGQLTPFWFEGTTHTVYSCDQCATYVWSTYGGRFANCRFVRVGTLDDANLFPPDVHIFTNTRQPWVVIPEDAARYDTIYSDVKEIWTAESIQRLAVLNETYPRVK